MKLLRTYYRPSVSFREHRLIFADNLAVTAGSGTTMAADEVTDGTLGSVKVGFGKIMDGTLDSTNKLVVGSGGAAETQGDAAHDAAAAGNPVLQGGVASATAPTSVSADGDAVNSWHLRNGAQATVVTAAGALIGGDAANGLDVDVTRVSGTVTVDGSGVTQPVSNAGLTELAAAINSSQLDINIAASAATLTVASHAVTNAGTFAVQVDGAALTALQLIDDPVATFGTTTYTETTTKGMTIGAVRRDADTTLVDTTNEIGPLQMDANGRLKVEAFSGEALPVTQSGTWDEVGINDSGNSITIDNAQLSVVGSGTEATAMRVTIATDSTGVLSVDDNGSSLTVDNGGTFAVQDSTAQASLSIMDDWDNAASDGASVSGDVVP